MDMFDFPLAEWERGAINFLDPQFFQADTAPDDINNGVNCPDLVEMDLLNGQAVGFGFCLG